ncbi:transketolase C-terminal domain-containing protein [Elusimicrobiota bacterium]
MAVGCALNAKLDNKKYRVYCIIGDGEHDEGSVWESVMSAAHYKLDNLVAIVDNNGLQIDGSTDDVMCLGSLCQKYKAFGWNVIEIDGHDMDQIIDSFEKARTLTGKPTVIIAETVKGKGVSYAENSVGYHGVAPKDGRTGDESLDKALADIGAKGFTREKVDRLLNIAQDYQSDIDSNLKKNMPKFSRDYWWNSQDLMKVRMEATRTGFGRALEEMGEDDRIVAHGADITSSIKMNMFYENHPERKNRFFSVGIAEANMLEIASGFAREGKISFVGSYGVFATGRAWDQIRTTVCYNNLNVKIADAHGGISVGPDGATHQALEEIAVMACLPNMTVVVPCDSNETYRITKSVAYKDGPAVIRYARESTPLVTSDSTPYEFAKALVIRFRKETDHFIDAFEWILADDYAPEDEDITIAACGPMVPEAMRASWILKQEFDIDARILNIHTVKPIDEKAVLKAAYETKAILTCEEHQVGGFGNIIAGIIARKKEYNTPFILDMIGVPDSFGKSGGPWELMKDFGLIAEHIAQKAKELLKKKG